MTEITQKSSIPRLGANNMDSTHYRINSLGVTNFFNGAMWPEVPEHVIGLGQTQAPTLPEARGTF